MWGSKGGEEGIWGETIKSQIKGEGDDPFLNEDVSLYLRTLNIRVKEVYEGRYRKI